MLLRHSPIWTSESARPNGFLGFGWFYLLYKVQSPDRRSSSIPPAASIHFFLTLSSISVTMMEGVFSSNASGGPLFDGDASRIASAVMDTLVPLETDSTQLADDTLERLEALKICARCQAAFNEQLCQRVIATMTALLAHKDASSAMISALCKVVINLILQYSPGLAAVHDTQFCEVLAAFDLQGLQPVHKGIALQAVYLLAAQSQLCSDTLNTTHLRHQLFGCLAISPEQWTHLDAERTGVVQQAMRCLHVLGRVAWKEEATMAEAQQIAIMGQIVLRNCADELVREVVEMLLVIPPEMQPFQSGQEGELDVAALDRVVGLVETHVLTSPLPELRQLMGPAIMLLRALAKAHKPLRIHLRRKFLPPRMDLSTRPDEGEGLRPKMIQLMTEPQDHLNLMVSDFLLVLCGGNVGRLVRKTGVGQAAGLLASLGLLGGDVQPTHPDEDESEEDEAEQQEQALFDRADPVTARHGAPAAVEPEREMTEEEKEQSAAELVGLIRRLNSLGVFKCNLPGITDNDEED
eukprot:TRINITY_DN12591_c0_g1_i16.p1 TRINITY_DN12591_c0_g1~~TRINITY_DN12591_c0_g1_i16.p1  ORF type:complete len:522 (+),score=107.56 TRINITY_DN12591_c0_g1_i16:271-1836(+)